MSQENVELVRVVHEGWARGDFRAGKDLMSADFSWDQPSEAVEPGSRSGAEVGQSLRNLFEIYEDFRVEADEFVDVGDRVVVTGRNRGTARGSGMELNQEFAYVWDVRGGELARLRVFTDRAEALATAGDGE